MNYVRYVVVLIAAFFLMIPAFSIPDDGHSIGCSDNQQKTFGNQNSMMGSDGHQIGPKSMMGNDGPKIVCLTICKVIGGGQEQAGPSSMMGKNGQDGKDKTCGCQNSNGSKQSWNGESGQNGQHNSWNHSQKSWNGDSSQDGQENTDNSQ